MEHVKEKAGCEILHSGTCACISGYVLMVMGQSVETWVDDQWRTQAFTTFPENMEYSSALVYQMGGVLQFYS